MNDYIILVCTKQTYFQLQFYSSFIGNSNVKFIFIGGGNIKYQLYVMKGIMILHQENDVVLASLLIV